MANGLRTAAAWLASMRQQHASDQVTYRRGAEAVALLASPAPITYEIEQAGGAVIQAQRWDWVVRREDMVFGGAATDPAEGDRIEQTVGSSKRIFELMPAGTEAHAEVLDPDASYWLVHSKLVDVQ